MKRIPREIDELMWLVAEQNEIGASESFMNRYPEYRTELISRLNMVRQFRAAGKAVPRQTRIPNFSPPVVQRTSSRRWLSTSIAALGLAVLGFASYRAVSTSLGSRPVQHVASNDNKLERFVEAGIPVKTSVGDGHENSIKTEPLNKPTEDDKVTIASNEKPISIRQNGITLEKAIHLTALAGGLKVDMAPGLADMLVSVDYTMLPALDILRGMGSEFGFSVFDEGDGRVLIVPAVDRSFEGNGKPPRKVEDGQQPNSSTDPMGEGKNSSNAKADERSN